MRDRGRKGANRGGPHPDSEETIMDVTSSSLTRPGALRDPVGCGPVNVGEMPTTDRCIDIVASLLVTIHRDESGGFFASIEAAPPALRMAPTPDLAPYASEWVAESKTFATAAPEGTRAGRRRSVVAAALVGAVLVGAVLVGA